MDQFIDTSSRYADHKISNLGIDVNNIYGKTVSLTQDNRALTVMIGILVIIIIILLIIMYRVYNHVNAIEDLFWGTSYRFGGGRSPRGSRVVIARRGATVRGSRVPRETVARETIQYESDYEEETDYESDWE